MAEIKAFKALRFTDKAGDIRELVCPPYDIISESQRSEYLARNTYNVVRLELPKDGEDPYKEAGNILDKWTREEILKKDPQEGIYIYEEEFDVSGEIKKIKGLVCLVKLEEFSKGIVLPHEETLSKAKTDRLNLMKATGCNFSQIYSLYMDADRQTASRIDELSASAPDIEFKADDGVTQRLWSVYDSAEIEKICDDFIDRKIYIADGHHRYETALNYNNYLNGAGQSSREAGYVMMILVDMENPGLVVFPTHRLIRDLKDFDSDLLLEKLEDYFEIIKRPDYKKMEAEINEYYQKEQKAFGYYCGGEGYFLLALKDKSVMDSIYPDKSEALKGLDVSVLHSLILERAMGIDAENMKKQINLTYTKYFDEAISSVQSGEYQCAFILNPTRVTEIRDIAAAGEKMPQKSTYFYPKIITGLIMNKIDD